MLQKSTILALLLATFALPACAGGDSNPPGDPSTTTTTTSSSSGGGQGGQGGEGGGQGGQGGQGGSGPACGDGSVDPGEACDDGDTDNGDGCDDTCTVESGYACAGEPSVCKETCGDGDLDQGEECDDGNTTVADGCDGACVVEVGWSCSGTPSACVPTCGDGLIHGTESCDDGNTTTGDGCDDGCATEIGWSCAGEPSACATGCGDGIIAGAEVCDDANIDDGDGCTGTCVAEAGWYCSGQPSACNTNCADGLVAGAEACDDGNPAAGDGCDAACAVESGWTCSGEPSACATTCGDGIKAGTEACDDGDATSGDGCSATCDIEPGWSCVGQPSNCITTCGDGIVAGAETCDDADATSGDGCSASCAVEAGYTCAGAPSVCSALCGDGIIVAGLETCDDNNAAAGDGCSPSCSVEAGWFCSGAPSACATVCGDGIVAGAEGCDDANAVPFDGCTSCVVQTGYVCTGQPSSCATVCGDGVIAGSEECDDGNVVSGDVCDSSCQLETVYPLNQNFDGPQCPPAGWTLGGDWQCGTPSVVGPATAFSAPSCLGTIINGNYNPNQAWGVAVVTTPPIDLTTAVEPVLSMKSWVYTEGSSFDGYNVKISTNGGQSFSLLTAVTPAYNLTVNGESAWGGNQSALGWQNVSAALSAYIGQTVVLRIAFRTDGSFEYPGVYVDDFFVGEAADVPLSITTATLPDASVGYPYQAQLAKSGGSAAAVWSITGGTNNGWLTIDPSTGMLSGTPALADLGPVTLTVHVEEPSNPANFADKTFNFNVAQVIYQTSFEGACPNGWALTGDWQCGVPTSGPNAAYDGLQCLGTQLAGNYNNGQAWGSTNATSPVIDLTGVAAASVSFRMWVDTEGSSYDGANLKVSVNGGPFTIVTNPVPAYNLTIDSQPAWGAHQTNLGWQAVTANLNAYAGQQIQLQFAFRTDGSIVYPGIYIDRIVVQ